MSDVDELLRTVHAVRHDLDELSNRLERLEHGGPVAPGEAIRRRRQLVVRMRAEGLSIERIARAIGIASTTVQNDLRAVGAPPPTRVVGTTGKAWTYPGA